MAAPPPVGDRMILRTLLALALATSVAEAELHVLIVGGLGGEERYEQRFAEEIERLERSAKESVGEAGSVIVVPGSEARQEKLAEVLLDLKNRVAEGDELAVYLIGHGTSTGRAYKFNIPGPDVTARWLADRLTGFAATRQVVVVATSSSGAALDALEAPGRIVVTATKNGRERNAAWFSKYWTDAFEDPEADVNKDERITVQEAYAYADAKVQSFFESASNLATEHARLSGDAAESFTLARLGKAAEIRSDPALRPIITQRDSVEQRIEQLKLRKEAMDEDAYFDELETLLLELATLDAAIDEQTSEAPQP